MSSRVASGSGSPSPGRSAWGPRFSSSTRRSGLSTRRCGRKRNGSRCGTAMRSKAFSIAVLVLSVGLVVSLTDLYKVQQGTLIVYTTPALQGLLESLVVPLFQRETGIGVTLVYVSAGEQYTRLRMSGGHPEADLFLHASPLFLEKGSSEGFFLPFQITRNASVPPNFQRAPVWYAFAWSPLAEVYDPALGAPPDLAFINTTFGFPHPLLSNNGIYAVLFFENALGNLSKTAGARGLAHTVVQPANARANILGIADHTFEARSEERRVGKECSGR